MADMVYFKQTMGSLFDHNIYPKCRYDVC